MLRKSPIPTDTWRRLQRPKHCENNNQRGPAQNDKKALLKDTYMVDSAPVADMSVEKYWLRWAPSLLDEFSLCCIINENRFSCKRLPEIVRELGWKCFRESVCLEWTLIDPFVAIVASR